jgi:hypothetical protein
MWKTFGEQTAAAQSFCRHIICSPAEIVSGTAGMGSLFGSVLSYLNSRPEPSKKDFVAAVYNEGCKKFESGIVARFANVFSVEFGQDQIYFKNEDEHERLSDFHMLAMRIEPSFIPKLKVPESFREFKQKVISQAPMFSSQWTEAMFMPNKPSQMAPSTKGPMLYIPGLIKFCLTDGQENKIWLEKIAGLTRNYRVTIVVDSSYSCFNDAMLPHTCQTLFGFLRVLSQINIPFFDLVVATTGAPRILAVNQNTQRAIDFQSFQLLGTLFAALTENGNSSNLADAIQVAMKIKSLSTTKRSYLFVLTDGLFSDPEKQELRSLLRHCRANLIEVFGIAVGCYPAGAFSIFAKCVWSLNPRFLISGISGFFGNEIVQTGKKIGLFAPPPAKAEILAEVFKRVMEKWGDICRYKAMYRTLCDATLYSESNLNFQFEVSGLCKAGAVNPDVTPETAMYEENSFAGQKILVCCFWSKAIAGANESEFIDPMYLTQCYPGTKLCVQKGLDHFGITLEIVTNYKDGIQEMGTGQYYATWIICGAGTGQLPDDGNANLVGQFLSCVTTFWKSGGAIVWWCDNDPLTYECNEWLKITEFPGFGKIGLQLVEGCEGGKTLTRGDIKQTKQQVFSTEKERDQKGIIRPLLCHNLATIYEGVTISKANDPAKLGPFEPFAYDSSGGISSMFLLSDYKSVSGDVIIDCGFTKLFTELQEDGTLRYVQNIACMTIQCEKRKRESGENGPKIFRPTPFTQKIDETAKGPGFRPRFMLLPFDVLYLCDATGSMSGAIEAAKNQCVAISHELQSRLPQFQFQFGAVFYRDPVDSLSDRHEQFPLSNDIRLLQSQIGTVIAYGGGDGPEDWVGAYRLALNMKWRAGNRLIIHLADAPAHTREFCNRNNHEEEKGKLPILIRQCAASKIKIIGMPIGEDYSMPSYNQCRQIYMAARGELYEIKPFGSSSDLASMFKDQIVNAVISAAPKTLK